MKIEIAQNFIIDDACFHYKFIKASGPGGQNVNKVSTAVQIRFSIDDAILVSEEVKLRIKKVAASKFTKNNEIVIESKKYRTQEQNRIDAYNRLITQLKKWSQLPKRRKSTKPTKVSVEKRLAEKKIISEKKKMRKNL